MKSSNYIYDSILSAFKNRKSVTLKNTLKDDSHIDKKEMSQALFVSVPIFRKKVGNLLDDQVISIILLLLK